MFDSRSTLRYPIDMPVQLEVGESALSGRIRNLSLGGAFVAGPQLPVGTRCRVRFESPDVEAFDAWCTTRWTTSEGCGLQFESVQAIDSLQLARVVRHASRASARLPTDAELSPR